MENSQLVLLNFKNIYLNWQNLMNYNQYIKGGKMKVFISHQKRDKNEAEQIANYLKKAGILVYFDEYDCELQIATRTNNPNGVVKAIKNGINSSTHMLCIVSPNTLSSTWVPFEIGYGHDVVHVATLTLKGISNFELPDYVKINPIIRDIYDVIQFVEKHGNSYKVESLNERYNFSKKASYTHPLSDIMDTMITD